MDGRDQMDKKAVMQQRAGGVRRLSAKHLDTRAHTPAVCVFCSQGKVNRAEAGSKVSNMHNR